MLITKACAFVSSAILMIGAGPWACRAPRPSVSPITCNIYSPRVVRREWVRTQARTPRRRKGSALAHLLGPLPDPPFLAAGHHVGQNDLPGQPGHEAVSMRVAIDPARALQIVQPGDQGSGLDLGGAGQHGWRRSPAQHRQRHE